MAGSIGVKSQLYRAVERVKDVHKAAVKKKVNCKKVWIATDEYTDTAGHAIINLLVGAGADIFVVRTVQLECRGKSMGVEHSELGQEVVDTLSQMGIELKNVIAFVSDAASVLRKAFDEYLKPLCKNAKWVPCFSHALNNVAKALVNGLDPRMVDLFDKGFPFLHAKRQAARRRRWFVGLISVNVY